MFEMKPLNEVVRIAAVGGGFEMNAGLKQTNDLVQIAAAAAKGNAHVIFVGLDLRPTEDLVRIASAGSGTVSFRSE